MNGWLKDIIETRGEDTCPCCQQYTKVYKRKLYSTPTIYLMALYKLMQVEDRYYHLNEVMSSIKNWKTYNLVSDVGKAELFGLVKRKGNDFMSDKKSTGYWKLTRTGIAFVRGEITIPKYAIVYNGEVYGYEGEQVDVGQCLGDKFSYSELMA